MQPRRALEDIRRLCVSGSGTRLAVPAVARMLRPLLGIDSCFFFWIDGPGEVSEVFTDPPPPAGLLELYAEEFHDAREDDALPRFSESLRRGPAVATLELSRLQRQRSAFYHEILRPIRSGYQAWLVLRDGRRPLGLMALHRSASAGPFDDGERLRMERLVPLLVHALSAPGEDAPMAPTGESAMLVLSETGDLLYVAPGATELLAMATSRLNWPRPSTDRPDRLLPAPVRELTRTLLAAESGADIPPPAWSTRSGWGRFTFRAYPLDPASGDLRAIAVVVSREAPAPFLVAGAVVGAPLSPRQKELCVHLAGGASYGEIATRMGISRHTVVEYSQAVFDRLGVRGREALVDRLIPVPRSSGT